MSENKNIDPLEALLAKQKAVMEGKQVDEVESVSFADETLVGRCEDLQVQSAEQPITA